MSANLVQLETTAAISDSSRWQIFSRHGFKRLSGDIGLNFVFFFNFLTHFSKVYINYVYTLVKVLW